MPVPFRKTPLAVAISAVFVSSGAHAFTVTPAGDEFEVPQDSGNLPQFDPDVASDMNGNFVVVWQDLSGPSSEIFARRFAADGSPLTTEIQVSSGSDRDANPVVAMDIDGDFVVAWEQTNLYYDIAYRLFQPDGTPEGASQIANATGPSSAAFEPDVAMDADGDIVITWEQYATAISNYEIAYRLFAAGTGTQLAPTAFANPGVPGFHPEVARLGTGEFVIAWERDDGGGLGIVGKRFDASGIEIDVNPFPVNITTANDQDSPAIDIDADGDFAIGWVSADPSNGDRIDARLFDWNATPLTGEVPVSPPIGIGNPQDDPAIALRQDNEWVASWTANGLDGALDGVFARPFFADGTPAGNRFQVNQSTGGDQRLSRIAMDDSGDFVVAFQGFNVPTDEEDVLARRFSVANLIAAFIEGTGGGPGSLGWLGALGLGLLAAGRRLFGSRRQRHRRGGGLAGVLLGALALGGLSSSPPAEAQLAGPERAGYVDEISGRVSADRPGESVRSLSRGDPIYTGDIVRTAARARAVLRLVDGTRVSLRASSEFRVAEVQRTRDAEGKTSLSGMFMDLLRGGLRLITGSIADRDREDYQLRTPVATIGVRGTEFDARLCPAGQCPEIEEDVEEGVEPVARALQVHGVVRVEGINGAVRVLNRGAGVYRDDTVITADDAWAVLRFQDRSKVSLQPGTIFRIDEWEFDRNEPDEGNALLNLLRGGLRVLTGLIGSEAADDYQVQTPVATIGVRGTGFDLQCLGDCIDAAVQAVRSVQGDGLLVSAWDGEIFARLEGRIAEFAAGQSGFLANATAAPLRLPQVPQLLRDLPAPRPDTVSGALEPQGADRMYTSVQDGAISVQGAFGPPIGVAAGEAAAIAAGGAAQPLSAVPGAVGTGLGVPAATIAGAFGQLVLAQFDLGAWYAGGTAGAATAGSESEFENRIRKDFPSASVASLDGETAGVRVFGGFRLLGLLGLEVGYVNLGELESKIDPGSASPAAVADDALDEHPFTPSGIDVSTMVFAPGDLFGNTRAFARAGLFRWEGEIETVTPSGQKFSKDVSGTDPLVGGGLEIRLAPNVHARTEWIHYELDPDPVDYFGAGVVWTLP